MKPQTKLAMKRWAVRQIRKLLWMADEWVHAQEVALRDSEQALHETHTQCLKRPCRIELSSGGVSFTRRRKSKSPVAETRRRFALDVTWHQIKEENRRARFHNLADQIEAAFTDPPRRNAKPLWMQS